MGKHLKKIITLCVTASRPLPQDKLFHLCEVSIREKGNAESLFSKDASGQLPGAQMNGVILAGWVQHLIVVVKAPRTEKGIAECRALVKEEKSIMADCLP